MRKLFCVGLLSLSSAVFACDHNYDVSGTDENGNYVSGTVCAYNGDRNVSGEVIDSNGDRTDIAGQWNGYGSIEATTNDGLCMDLETS